MMFRFEAAEAKFLRYELPGAWEELISTGSSAGVPLDDDPFRMAGQILKLPAAIKSAIALILTIGPGALCIANGVQQSAPLRSEPIRPLFLNVGQQRAFEFRNAARSKTGRGGNR